MKHIYWESPKEAQAREARDARELWAIKVNALKPVTPRGNGKVLPSTGGK